MSESVYAGLTSQTIDVFLGDSSSTTGGGLTGLTHSSSGLTAYYRKGATGTATAITLATQTVGGAWSSGGFVQVDSTNMPGVYRFDVPNAVVDTEGFATVYFRGAANLVPTAIRIDCRPYPVDVKKFGGANGTFSGGRPEVNTTRWGGTAVTATLFDGITQLARWLGAIAGKAADTATRAEINATTAGASYNETTDSLEAQQDSGGGGGGDCPTVEEIAAAVEDVLTGIDITVSATSLVDGEPLRITKGDDYESSATPSTAIVMTLTGTGLHSTTADTWKLWLNTPGADPVETTAAATSSATNSLTLTFELSKTQTNTLTTIAGGTWTVRQVTASTAYKSAKKSGRLIVIPNPETERAA